MRKIISVVLSFGLLFQQSGLVYAVGELNLANYLSQAKSAIIQPDQFRPAQLRYISYNIKSNDFKLLLDKGDVFNQKTEKPKNEKTLEFLNSPNSSTPKLNPATQELFNYFLIGLSLPNDTFWVNLRPDAPENIIDPLLEKTDIGKIFLEADLQLKKDTASLTSPQNPEGKSYWDKLYKKAGELFGTENITIPTITRPWIVPNEVIVRETEDSAYIYKATLKVMLEADYLIGRGGSRTAPTPDQYAFSDPRLKELNEYSSQIIRETIIPKLTKEINSSKRYAQLRQVYYSLVLARWFKQKYSSLGSIGASANSYLGLIDSRNLVNLVSKGPCDKQAYFQAYQKSFKDGEYNLKETVSTPFGQSIRSYISGGLYMTFADSPITGIKVPNRTYVTETLTGQQPPATTASPVSYGKKFEWTVSKQKGASDAAYEWARIGLVLLKSGNMEEHRERFEWTLYHQKGASDAAEESARIGLVLLKSGDMEKHRERFEWTLYHQKGASDVAEELARIGLVLLKSGDKEEHRERFEWTLYHQKGASDAAEEAARIGLLILDKGADALYAGSPLTEKQEKINDIIDSTRELFKTFGDDFKDRVFAKLPSSIANKVKSIISEITMERARDPDNPILNYVRIEYPNASKFFLELSDGEFRGLFQLICKTGIEYLLGKIPSDASLAEINNDVKGGKIGDAVSKLKKAFQEEAPHRVDMAYGCGLIEEIWKMSAGSPLVFEKVNKLDGMLGGFIENVTILSASPDFVNAIMEYKNKLKDVVSITDFNALLKGLIVKCEEMYDSYLNRILGDAGGGYSGEIALKLEGFNKDLQELRNNQLRLVDNANVMGLSVITLNSGVNVRLNGWGPETLREVLEYRQPVDLVVCPPQLYRNGVEYGSPEFLVNYNLFRAPDAPDAPINLGWRRGNYTFLVAQDKKQKEAIERIISRSFLGSPREFYEKIQKGEINIEGISSDDISSADIEHFMRNRTKFPTISDTLEIGQFVKVYVLGEEFDYKTRSGSDLKLKIERDDNGRYRITETVNGQAQVYQNIAADEYRPPVMRSIAVTNAQIDAHNFLNRPEFGYTILGDSHGFDPYGNNTCILVSAAGKYLLIDGSPATYQITKDLKIPSLDIEYVFLTHTHDDHDAILNRVLNGFPVKLIATPAVYANFVAKANDKLKLYGQDINIGEWVDYIKILPGQRLPIFNGKAVIECPSFYNKHTLPTSAVKIGYIGEGGDIESSISYTADTQLDPNVWEFVKGSNVIFHDAGILPLHPSPEGVAKQITDKALMPRVILVHASDEDVKKAGSIGLTKGDVLKSTTLIPADLSARIKDNDNISKCLAAVAYLSSLSSEALQALAKKTRVRNFLPGNKIVKQGETTQSLQPSADVLYLIVSGEAKVNIAGEEIRLKPGMTFGEFSAVNPLQPRSVDVVAGDNGLVAISFSKAAITALIKDFPEVRESVERIQHNLLYLERLSEIEKSPFNQLPIEVLYDLAEKLKVVEFEKGKDILIEGEQSGSEGAYIITEGYVEVASKSAGKLKEIYDSSPDNVFGEGAFFNPGGKRNATVTAMTEVKALHITSADFQKALEHHPSLKYKFYVLSANRGDENANGHHRERAVGSPLTETIDRIYKQLLSPIDRVEFNHVVLKRITDGDMGALFNEAMASDNILELLSEDFKKLQVIFELVAEKYDSKYQEIAKSAVNLMIKTKSNINIKDFISQVFADYLDSFILGNIQEDESAKIRIIVDNTGIRYYDLDALLKEYPGNNAFGVIKKHHIKYENIFTKVKYLLSVKEDSFRGYTNILERLFPKTANKIRFDGLPPVDMIDTISKDLLKVILLREAGASLSLEESEANNIKTLFLLVQSSHIYKYSSFYAKMSDQNFTNMSELRAVIMDGIAKYINDFIRYDVNDSPEYIKTLTYSPGPGRKKIEKKIYNLSKLIDLADKRGEYTISSILKFIKECTSSPLLTVAVNSKGILNELKRGGIDLTDRMLNMQIERVGSFALSALALPEIANVEAIDLDKEYERIQAMVSSSIRPSDTRILEFAAACYYRGEFDQRLTQVSSCIKSAHLADEISGRDSSPALRLATMLPDALYGG